MSEKRINVLRMISQDMEDDVAAFTGKPFNGRTVGEYFGSQAAAIRALANIMASILEENDAKITPKE